jgi:hypothetical protein
MPSTKSRRALRSFGLLRFARNGERMRLGGALAGRARSQAGGELADMPAEAHAFDDERRVNGSE